MKRFFKRVSLPSLSSARNSTSPTAHAPPPPPSHHKRTKQIQAQGPEWNKEGYLLRHLGSAVLKEPYSSDDMIEAMRSGQNDAAICSVHLQLTNGTLAITDLTGQVLVEANVSLLVACIQDLKNVQDCIGIVFPTAPQEHHLHIFQAMSCREAGVIVQHLGHAIRQDASAEGGGDSEERGVTLQPHPPEIPTPSHSSSGSGSSEKRRYVMNPPTGVAHVPPTEEAGLKAVKEKEGVVVVKKETAAVAPKKPSVEEVRTYGQPSSEQTVTSSEDREAPAPPPTKECTVTVRRTQSSNVRRSTIELSPRQHRRVSVKRVGSLDRGTTLSAEECIARVSRGAERVKDSNRKLVSSCKNAVSNPSSPMDRALTAIFESDRTFLGTLLDSESFGVDSADEEGNTLLHYAVACQRNDVVKLLCERGAGVDAAGLSAVRPLHRAAVEGLVTILGTLLDRGASPHELDSNLRSPLHFACAVEDFLECTYALLERGARVYQKDALGVRPVDLNNPLKEMQGALVSSLCEVFSSTQLKEYEVVDVSSESLNSFSSPAGFQSVSQLFPCSSHERSLSSGSSSQERTHTTPMITRHDSSPSLPWQPQQKSTSSLRPVKSGSLEHLSRYGSTGSLIGSIRSGPSSSSDLLSRYVQLAQSRASRFKSKISQIRQSQLRRSSSQLFLEAEEDAEWKRQKLKFPSDFSVNFAGVEIEMNATDLEKQLNEFIAFSTKVGRQKRKEREANHAGRQQHAKLVLTEAEMEVQPQKRKASLHLADAPAPVREPSGDDEPLLSQVSSSTVEGRDSLSHSHHVISTEKNAGVGNGSHTSSDTLVNRHGSSETSSVITHYTTSTQAMSRAFSDLQKAVDHDRYRTQMKAVACGDSDEDIPRISIAKRSLHQVPRYVSAWRENNQRTQETVSVFEEILADIQGDIAYEDSLAVKEKSQRKQRSSDEKKVGSVPKPTLGPRVDLESVHASVAVRQRSSSALVTGVDRDSSSGRSLSQHPRSMSFTSSGSSAGPLHHHHHRWTSSLPFSMPSNEPGAVALKGLIMLSSNEECLSKLIQYVCLPPFSSRLVALARSSRSSFGMLANIAILIQNIYEVGGSEGRKKAVESGILGITIKLLKARDPIPGTMLQLLYHLMFSEEDPTNYLRAIAKIPIVPLLTFLEPGGDRDSGFENQLRDTSLSTPPSGTLENRSRGSTGPQMQDYCSPSGNLAQRPLGSSEEGSASRPSSQVTDHHGNPVRVDHPSSREGVSTSGVETFSSRTDSFHSDNVAMATTDSGGSSRSLTAHALHGQTMTFTEARRIALKLFAALSVYDKLHPELGTARAVGVLVDNLQSVSQENITNVVITLANLARNTETHPLMKHCSAAERLYPLLQQGPTIRHHTARALVYLGEIDTKGVSVFHRSNGYGAEEVCFLESEETQQVWGASLEHLVHYLIEDPAMLWTTMEGKKKPGGSNMGRVISPHPPSVREITWFFLVTMRSFVDPLIFLRLLLHRLAIEDPGIFSPQDLTSFRHHSSPLFTVAGERVFNIIEQWMVDSIDNPSNDFVNQPLLQKEVALLVEVLNNAKGPYSHYARNLKKLLDGLGRTRASSNVSAISERVPHHDHLYPLCQKMIVEGLLPVTQEQAITMAALQLHIQSLCGEQHLKQTTSSGIRGSFRKRSSPTQQARRALPAVFHKVKNITKRVQEQRGKWAHLSERNAKHLYIEKSQAIPGYGCQFFGVTLKSQASFGGGFFRKTQSEKRLLGISDKQMILMDGRTKQILRQFSFKDILCTERHEEPASVTIKLRDTQFTFLLEDRLAYGELVHILDGCEEYHSWRLLSEIGGRDDLEQFDPDWQAHYSHSMRENQYEGSLTPPTSGGPSPSVTMANLDAFGDSLDKVLTPAAVGMRQTMEEESGGGHVTMGRDVFGWQSGIQSPRQPNYDDDSDEDSEEEVHFSCDCPPDPELGPDLRLDDINVLALLMNPLELARQITLIDHGLLCHVTSADILHKIRMSPKPVGYETHASSQSIPSGARAIEQVEGAIEKLAFRFNQLGNWVASCVLYYDIPEERAAVIEKFIIVAKHCFELHNYSAVMAIVVTGLGSPSVRRLKLSWERVHEKHSDFLKKMNELMDSKGGYRNYREMLANTSLPAVPYFGVFLRDLTQIVEYNPDYVRGGLINLVKRRLIYDKLQEVTTFRRQHYNYHCVPEIRFYLLHTPMEAEDELHDISHRKEPKQCHAAGSQASLRSSRGSFSSITSIPSGFLRRLRHGSVTSVT